MHTNCVLSKFLLYYRRLRFDKVSKTSSLARLLQKVSRQTLAQDNTRSMTQEEKALLRFGIDHSVDHMIVSANILLFLERRNYIDIKVDQQHQGRRFEWNQHVVHAAIEDQKECYKHSQTESGAWILSHFVAHHKPCEFVLANPVKLASFADDIISLIELSPASEVQSDI